MKDASQPQTTRDAILDATDRLLARYGYKKMTIDALAKEVGIGKGSIYLHFSSKEEIALSHIERIIDNLKLRLNEIATRAVAADVRLRDMLIKRVLVRFDSVQHYSQSLNELLGYLRPTLLKRRKAYFDEEAQMLAAVISEGQAEGIFAAGDALREAAATMRAPFSMLSPESEAASEAAALNPM